MACNFIPVKVGDSCKENFSGVGSKFYLFDGSSIAQSDWDAVVAESSYSDFKDEFSSVIDGLTLYQVDIKPKSGKVTSTNNKNGGGFMNTFTCVVASSMDVFSGLCRTLNNATDYGLIVPAGTGNYYLMYDKDFGIDFEDAGDTGDTADSDHGHTVTFTCGPMLYPLAKAEITIDPSNLATITTSTVMP